MAEIAQIIKYEGDNTTFIWKHPLEDFNSGTQLIVHESQEALFYMNGQALDLFGAGRYTLETQNIPLVRKILNKPTNDETPFHCEVYFINKTEQMGIKWGLDSKVNYLDSNYNDYPFPVGSSGEMSLRVVDSRKLLVKLIGTVYEMKQQSMVAYFKPPMMMRIKSYLPAILKKRNVPIFDIDQYITEFSADIHKLLCDDFLDYGIEISKFWITNLVKPEEDSTYRKLQELRGSTMTAVQAAQLQQQIDIIQQQTKAQALVIESQAKATKRAQEGYTYQQERGFDVASDVAKNDAIGEFTNTGMGLGMMGGMAGGMGFSIAEMASDAMKPIAEATQNKDNAAHPNSSDHDNSKESFVLRVEKLKAMHQAGLLTDEEFNDSKMKLLNSI